MAAARWSLERQPQTFVRGLDDCLDVCRDDRERRDGKRHLAMGERFRIRGDLRHICPSCAVGHTQAVGNAGQDGSHILHLEGILRSRIKVFNELELEGHIGDVANCDVDWRHFLDFGSAFEVRLNRGLKSEQDRHMRGKKKAKQKLSWTYKAS